jgi:hypothetical protein
MSATPPKNPMIIRRSPIACLCSWSFILCVAGTAGSTWAAVALPGGGGGKAQVTGDAALQEKAGGIVTLALEKGAGRAVVVFDFSGEVLDLSAFRDLSVPIQNGTDAELDVLLNATSNPKMNWRYGTSGRFIVHPGETQQLSALMARPSLGADHPFVKRLGRLHAYPWGHQSHWRHMEVSAVVQVMLRIKWKHAAAGQTIEIGRPRGQDLYSTDPALLDSLELPLLDPFGQLRAADWPGKLKHAGEFQADFKKDMALVSKATKPGEGRSRFGGLAGGPKREATGYFRVEKLDGKWWFVDPEGNLFWSHGVNCAGTSVETRVKGREDLFPKEDRGKEKVSHYWDNLQRKFGGDDWRARHGALIAARMFDWGLNTVGAWSIAEVIDARKIPYTLIVHADLQPLGKVKKIADPFSPAFQNSLDRIMPDLAAKHADSPWLLGVFIDNELDWQGGHELVKEIIHSYPQAPARVALVEFLRGRHQNVAGLNKAWNTGFKDLVEIEATPGPLGEKAFAKDLDDFLAIFADRYYTLCHGAMRKYFPNHLYLGTRFHVFNPIITAAASRHCDVISANIYQHSFEEFSMKTDRDRPWLISEFHFGVRDHGVWGVGLSWAADARNQADLYQAYVSDALRHPNFVGTHWFAWATQTTTGRFDGENFGVGLVTMVDRPLEKLVGALGNISRNAYAYRLGHSEDRIGDTSKKPPASKDGAAIPKP